ncbi:N-acetyl-gamma-glutamyl-phosphate reductase [Longispora albida]|uniref:N-acetyl-gamma-glutamyl-phosphate reductase n=1 Tax=Longispora albida TaxID=203523 RepID=UPI00036AF6BD|nr:N-acetyl-gamma-glutamyl-phosphate reductase [Longispora albida]
MGFRVAVAGASGYAGGELLRLLSGHPELEIGPVTAHGSAGTRLSQVHPHLVTLADRVLEPTTPEILADADLVFLALPHGQSAAIAAQLPAEVKVVDLGADHRLADAAQWEKYYGSKHAGPWTYGLPELPGQREAIAASSRVAATGCYAATIILALRPILASGLGSPEDVVVVAASGTSGAGTAPKKHLLGSEVMGDLTGYKVGAHQHVPEIKQATGALSVSMTPILAPMPRGILAAVTVRAVRPVNDAAVRDVLTAAYQGESFVHVQNQGLQPRTAATYGSNSVHLQGGVDLDSGRIIVTSALDNLGKGAAGGALQCANLMLGLPETTGLSINGVAP